MSFRCSIDLSWSRGGFAHNQFGVGLVQARFLCFRGGTANGVENALGRFEAHFA